MNLNMIYDAGYDAYHDGVDCDDNPYDVNTDAHDAWNNGWDAGAWDNSFADMWN